MSRTLRTAAQTAVIMAVFTLGSKLFGFVREMVMANFFGASYITDAYVMAIAVPSIIFGGLLSAVSVAFIPIYSNTIEQEGDDAANSFTSGVLNVLAAAALIAGILGLIFSDQVVYVFASGFEGETATLTSYFLRVTFFYLIFSATADILEAFLRYKGVFIPQVAFGFIQNIILIGVIVFSAYTSYYYLVFGYLLVYFIRLCIMTSIAKKRDFRYYPNVQIDKTVKHIISLSLPVFIGNSANQISSFVDKTLASGLPEGSVSALNYGNLLVAMISGLTISIMTTIIYPKLAQANATNDSKRLTNIVETGISLIVIVAAPCTLGAMIYSNQVVQIVYERGAFDPLATSMTGTAFLYYVIGLTFYSMVILFNQVYYSKHNMKSPVIFGIISVIIDIIMNLILVKPMAHGGLALSTSIGAICGTIFLYTNLKKQYQEIREIIIFRKLIKILVSSAISVGASFLTYQFIILPLNGIFVARTVQLLLAVGVAGLIYLLLLYLLKIEELNLLTGLIKRKTKAN